MMPKFLFDSSRTALPIVLVAFLAWGCSGRRVDMDSGTPATAGGASGAVETKDPKDVKIESLTNSLSRAQARIEELDAKLSALSDKVDATRIAVDNIGGSKQPATELVGSAKSEAPAAKPGKTHAKKAAAKEADEVASDDAEPQGSGRRKAVSPDAEPVLMEAAISEFNHAMGLFKAGKYADSELSFNHLTEQYPEHVLAGSAQFYAGESYFMMGEYKLALNEYQKVVATFSSSPRVASAIVRMSHCYTQVGNGNEAARTMALARETFDGNPSLDWPAPSGKSVANARAQEKRGSNGLSAEPIEPTERAQAAPEKDGKDAD